MLTEPADDATTVRRRDLLSTAAAASVAGAAMGSVARPTPAGAVEVTARPVRVLVASVDAPANVKAGADFVCSGTNDHVVLNNAITQAATGPIAGSTEGALNSVECSGGRYTLSGSVLLRSGVDVGGAGPYASILRAVGLAAVTGAGDRVAMVKLLDLNTHGCGIHGFTLEGNYSAGGPCDGLVYANDSASNPSGYPFTSPDPDCYAYDMYVHGFRGPGVSGAGRNGVYAATDMRGTLLHTLWIRDTSGDGLVLNGTPDSHVDRVAVGGAAGVGINIASGNNKVVNCKAFYCDIAGFRVSGNRCTLVGLEAQDSVVGFDLAGTPIVASALTADTCRDDGIKISNNRIVLSGFEILCRGGGRYPTQQRGLTFAPGLTRGQITGVINPANIVTPRSGVMGAPAFVRVDDGGPALYSVG